MNLIKIVVAAAVICFCMVFAQITASESPVMRDIYASSGTVISSGGTPSSSEDYHGNFSLAQPATIGISQSEDYSLIAGFWHVSAVCIHNGDSNQDGSLTAGDAQLAFYIAIGFHQPSVSEECSADCNGDGGVTAGDAQSIFYAAMGLMQCVDSSAVVPPHD